MATFEKRGQYWRVKVRRTGLPPQTRTFDNKTQAQLWARSVESEIDKGIVVDRRVAERLSLAEVLERYRREVTPTKRGAADESIRLKAMAARPFAGKAWISTSAFQHWSPLYSRGQNGWPSWAGSAAHDHPPPRLPQPVRMAGKAVALAVDLRSARALNRGEPMEADVVYVDVDDTLVRSVSTKRIPIPASIGKVRALHTAGATIYLWSAGGADYARASAVELGIADCFAGFLPKPTVIIDDQHMTEWRNLRHFFPTDEVIL